MRGTATTSADRRRSTSTSCEHRATGGRSSRSFLRRPIAVGAGVLARVRRCCTASHRETLGRRRASPEPLTAGDAFEWRPDHADGMRCPEAEQSAQDQPVGDGQGKADANAPTPMWLGTRFICSRSRQHRLRKLHALSRCVRLHARSLDACGHKQFSFVKSVHSHGLIHGNENVKSGGKFNLRRRRRVW